MAFTVFADGAKACIDFDWNGVGCSVCLHWEKASPAEADYIDLADKVSFYWEDKMLPSQVADLAMGDVTVYDLSEEFAPKYINSDESGSPGEEVSDSMANNTAVVISHRTTATGRSGRGRTYMPGVGDADVTDGLMSAAYVSEVLVAWASFITNIETDTGWDFVVAQRFLDGAQLTTGVMRTVANEILKRQLGTQRRRQVPSAV